MFQPNVFRTVGAALIALSLTWGVVSCASAPAKAPDSTTTTEGVAEAEFQAARDAIAEAEAAGAVELAPELLSQAKGALGEAEGVAKTDPAATRAFLKTAIDKAHEARDKALAAKAAKAADWKTLLADLDRQATEAIAEAKAAGAQNAAAELLAQAEEALATAREQGTALPESAKASYETAIDKAHQARDAARAALMSGELKALLDDLEQQAQRAVAEAEAAGAPQYAPDLLAQALSALAEARSLVVTTPTEAQPSYQRAIDRAHDARDAANKAALAELDQAAQAAIAEAEAAEADRYSPGLLKEARQALEDGRAKASSDPATARTLLASAADKARQATQDSLKNRTQALLGQLSAALERLKALNPEQWDPEGTAPVLAQGEAARAAVAADYATGLPLATEALAALDAVTSKLSSRLLAVQDLRVQAQKALDEAESADAYVWVPDLVESANDSFFAGTGAWKKFRLDAAEESWSMALFQAKSATSKALAEVERRRTEQLMLDTMKKLEEASGKTIVDPNDNIIAPQPWDGKKELERIKSKPVSVLIPSDGSVVVLGEKQRVTYLDEAKDQWIQGVHALELGDLALANEAFLQSQRLIDTYLAMAVDKIYTVRLIPDRRDSLWRISEYDGIYGTPWDWPKIWKRNQKLIQNPDLIYPGWQLIIPPQ